MLFPVIQPESNPISMKKVLLSCFLLICLQWSAFSQADWYYFPDEIYFVNAGEITRAGSFTDAVDKLLHNKSVS